MTQYGSLLTTTAFCFAVLTSPSLYAQSATQEDSQEISQTYTLEPIHVYADSYRSAGTKTALDPQDAPMSYTRIDSELLNSRHADSVNQALRYEPGVASESRGTVSIFDEYNIRGFKTYSNFYNGLRLPYDGTWNLMPQIDGYANEAVEVVKGPASALYGFGSPGGMVNQVAKTPQSIPANELRVRFGNQSFKEIAFDSTGPIADNLDYRFVALGRDKDGQMQTTEERRVLVNPSLTWRANEDLTVDFSIYYQDDPEMVPSTPLPSQGTVYEASYGKLDSDGYAGDDWVEASKQVFMPSFGVNWQINDQLTFKHTLRYTDADFSQQNIYNYGLYPGTDNILVRDAYTTDEEMDNIITDNQLAYTFNAGEVNHNLLFGLEYQRTNSEATYRDAGYLGTPLLDLSAPDYTLVDAATLPLANYQQVDDIEQRQLGIYLQDEIQWQGLTLVGGLRYDDYEGTNNTVKSSAGVAYSQQEVVNEDHELSGRIAAIYQFDNGFAPYASYSQSFQPQSGSNFITGEPFKATTADQIEAGIKYASSDNATQAALSVFKIKQENVIVAAPSYRNLSQTGEIDSTGFEISASQRVNDWVDVFASYSYVDAEITKDEYNPQYEGNSLPQTSKHQAALWADFYPTDYLMLNAGVRYQSGMPIDKANSDTLPSVTLVDVGGEYQFNDTLSAGFSVSNVFDETYVGTCFDLNNCWMGPERQMTFSLTAEF